MTQRKLSVRSETTSLLTIVEENPQLPAYVSTLPPTDLIRLVNFLGKEDAQALLVHATANQMSELIESDSWTSRGPGKEERFSPERFLEWLELWSDTGAAMLCKRVKELGSELFARTLHEYAVVIDIHEVGVDGPMDTFGDYGVIVRNDEIWPLLFEYITQIWDEDPDFMEDVFGHCCQRRSLTIEKTHITHNENLAQDVEATRDRHRRERGYVTSTSSAAFLKRIRISTLDELLVDGSYDGYSAVQLRTMREGARHDEELEASESTPTVSATDISISQPLRELHALISPLLQEPTLEALLLSGPEARQQMYIERQLARLGSENPACADARMTEILYLSNILMEGTGVNGNRLDQRDAMVAATHTANLGLTYCIFVEPWANEKELLVEFMENEPGLIKAFNVGYHLLMNLAQHVEAALESALQHESIKQRLQQDRELAKEIEASFTHYQTRRRAGKNHHEPLQLLANNLSILFDASTCAEIAIIGDPFPRFPESLTPGFQPGLRVNRSARFISEVSELNVVAASLEALTGWLLA